MKEKTCPLCEDKFRPTCGRQRYCSDTCRRIAARKRSGKERVIGVGKECSECGSIFVVKSSAQKYCSKKCCKDVERRKTGGGPVGNLIKCDVCGRLIVRTSASVIRCDQCTPPEGWTRECTCCGEMTGYGDYYDYRPVGKMMRTCKACLIKNVMERKYG